MSEHEELVAIANEMRRLQRQIETKTAQLVALTSVNGPAGEFPVDFEGARVRRYSVDIAVDAGSGTQPKTGQVTVKRGTIFRCAYVESFVRAVGTAPDPFTAADTTVQTTLCWRERLRSFDYFWRVRDSGSDREWSDQPQPAMFSGGGQLGPLWLPRRVVLGGNTVITVQVDPFRNRNDYGANGFFATGTVEQYIVQMSFVGHEVPDRSAL